MLRWPLAVAALCALSVLGIGMPTESRASVRPKYELIEIDIIGFAPNADTVGRFGINNRGEIAYTKKSGASSRAMLYLPNPAYGFDTSQSSTFNLTDIFGTITVPEEDGFLYGPSYARDISDSGFIVGQFGGVNVFEETAFVIDLADHLEWPNRSFAWRPSSAPEPCLSSWARAMAVTGDEDPVLVVETGAWGRCLSGLCADVGTIRCFSMGGLLTGLGGSPTHTLFPNLDCPEESSVFPSTFAFDAERNVSDGSVLLAGTTGRWTVEQNPEHDPIGCPITAGGGCWELTLSVRWDPAPVLLDSLSTEYTPVARGVNRAADVVGYGVVEWAGTGNCRQHAALWEGGGVTVTNLHDVLYARNRPTKRIPFSH